MNNLIEIYSSIKKEQKPIMRFLEIEKSNFLFNNFKRYLANSKSLLIILFLNFLSFSIAFQSSFFFNLLLIIIFFIVFFIWQIFQNTSSAFNFSKIYYEESSWFDIKIWQKPIFLIKNDKFFFHFKNKKELRAFYQNIFLFIRNLFFFILINYILHILLSS